MRKGSVMAAKVVNIRSGEAWEVRIDRKTIWGNPFRIGPDGTRAQVIKKYTEWIMQPEQLYLRERAKRLLRGKCLACWCAPLPCHGDVLLEIANSEVRHDRMRS